MLLESPEAIAGDEAAIKHRGVDGLVGQGAFTEAHAGGAGHRGGPHRKPSTRKDAARDLDAHPRQLEHALWHSANFGPGSAQRPRLPLPLLQNASHMQCHASDCDIGCIGHGLL